MLAVPGPAEASEKVAVAGEITGCVEHGGHRHNVGERDGVVRGPETDDTLNGSRSTDRAAGVGTERDVEPLVRGDGRTSTGRGRRHVLPPVATRVEGSELADPV